MKPEKEFGNSHGVLRRKSEPGNSTEFAIVDLNNGEEAVGDTARKPVPTPI